MIPVLDLRTGEPFEELSKAYGATYDSENKVVRLGIVEPSIHM